MLPVAFGIENEIEYHVPVLDNLERKGSLQEPQVAKKGKVRSRRSAWRDATQHLAVQALEVDMVLVSSAGVSVTLGTLHTPRSSTTWLNKAQTYPTLSYSAHRVPAPWERLSDLAREHWLNRAVAIEGGVPFSIHFDDAVELELRTCESAVDRFRREAARHLRAAFGSVPPFWFRFELTNGSRGRLHAHGGIVLPSGPREAAKARRALRRAAGEWSTGRQHQVRFGLEAPDDGWTTYVRKDAIWNVPGGIVERYAGRRFKGKPSYATNEIKRLAKNLYRQWRTIIMK